MNPATPLRLLLSRRTREELGARIAALAGPQRLLPMALEDVADDDAQAVDAVFISRDITGTSTKTLPSESLAACYRVIRRSGGLRWVHTHSAGADRPIYAELAARGVAISTSQGANAAVVAQTALGGVLALARHFPEAWVAQSQRQWAPLAHGPLPRDLAGQTAVLVGYGPIGRLLHGWLGMLGLQVVVVRHREAAEPGVHAVGYAALHTVLPRADWLILACPLTAQTRRLIDARALAALPPGAHLVNVARGEVVDEAALAAALQAGRLGGAFLDVFEHEPLPEASPLWTLPRVMISPHSAGQSDGNAARVAGIFLQHLRDWLDGRPVGTALAGAAANPSAAPSSTSTDPETPRP